MPFSVGAEAVLMRLAERMISMDGKQTLYNCSFNLCTHLRSLRVSRSVIVTMKTRHALSRTITTRRMNSRRRFSSYNHTANLPKPYLPLSLSSYEVVASSQFYCLGPACNAELVVDASYVMRRSRIRYAQFVSYSLNNQTNC